MLKKLTATGIVAAAAAGCMLLGGAANADRLSVNQTNHTPSTYHQGNHDNWSRWHHRQWHGWGRWHHRDWHHRDWHQHRYYFHH